jgi:hypothetical protein
VVHGAKEPLIGPDRPRRSNHPGWERIACAFGLVFQSIGLALFLLWEGLFGDYSATVAFFGVVVMALGPFAAAAVLWEPDDPDGSGVPAIVGLIAGVLSELFLVSVLLYRVVDSLVEAKTFGIDGRLDAVRLVFAAAGTLLLAVLLRTLALRQGTAATGIARPASRRVLAIASVVLAAVMLMGAVAGAAIPRHTLRCSPFEFDQQRWASAGPSSDRMRIARALVRCKTLVGKPRDEVARMLGVRPGSSVPLGSTGTGLFDSSFSMSIRYSRDGRVTRARVFRTSGFD